MKKIIFTLFIFLAACGQPAVASTATSLPPTASPSPSMTVTPTITLTPTITPTPTLTPDPNEFVDEKGVTMRRVPEGEFTMGTTVQDGLAECNKYRPTECPRNWFTGLDVYPVSLDAFYMDMYEVTNALYAACVTDGTCTPPLKSSSYTYPEYYGNPVYDNYPVIHVTWDQAKAYCEWRGASLPTEAQWQKSARGTEGNLYPWGNQIEGGEANYCVNNCLNQGLVYSLPDDGFADTAPVGTFEKDKSPYGIYDLAGNVAEWVADFYSDTYKLTKASRLPNPTGPASGRDVVLMGGSFDSPPEGISAAVTGAVYPGSAWHTFGFRCALHANP